MNLIPDDLKHPSGGERVTHTAGDAIRLAHRALERFPDVVRRHKFIAGGAAISTSLVALAGVAITRRMRSGQSEEEAIASLTEDELHGRRVELPEELSANGAGPHDDEATEDEAVTVESVAQAGEDPTRAAPDGEPTEGNGRAPSDAGQ